MRQLLQRLRHPHGETQIHQRFRHLEFGAALRPFFQSRNHLPQQEFGREVAAQKARVGGQVVPPDSLPQGTQPPLGAGAGQDDITVGGLKGEAGRRQPFPGTPRRRAGGLIVVHIAFDVRHHTFIHRHIQMLPPPGLPPRFQRQHDAQRRPQAGDGVADVVGHALRRAVGAAGDLHPARHRLNRQIVGRPGRVGAAQPGAVAVAGDAGVHQPRIYFAEPVVAQPQPPERPGAPVVQQHIRGPHQLLESPLAAGMAQVDADAFLVAVDAQKAGTHPLPGGVVNERPPGAGKVAAAGPLNLDDLGAHIGQNQRTERPGHDVRRIQHPNARQRQRQLFG